MEKASLPSLNQCSENTGFVSQNYLEAAIRQTAESGTIIRQAENEHPFTPAVTLSLFLQSSKKLAYNNPNSPSLFHLKTVSSKARDIVCAKK